MKVAPTTIELADFPRQLSLSNFLSPAPAVSRTTAFTIGGKPFDSVYLVLLALNEECRETGQGTFYHLPLRGDEHDAHPCDLIYLPDNWNSYDKKSWDQASWTERLEMCTMVGRTDVNEDVLPVCARILQFDNGLTGTHARRDSSDSDSGTISITSSSSCTGPVFNAAYLNESPTKRASSSAPTYQSDPAIRRNCYNYSRPMEDISTYLILYTSHNSTPMLCPTAAFEHESISTRFPTPGDFSETYSYGAATKPVKSDTPNGREQRLIADIAARYVKTSGISSNQELVERVWDLWHEKFGKKGELEKDWLGRVKYSWQEVKSIIDRGRLVCWELPTGWPTE